MKICVASQVIAAESPLEPWKGSDALLLTTINKTNNIFLKYYRYDFSSRIGSALRAAFLMGASLGIQETMVQPPAST